MLIYLLLILLVTAVSLTVILWAGSFFFQGYIYTEPSPGIFWQAPAAAVFMTIGFMIWCLTIAFTAKATPQNLPIDTIFRFSPKEEMPELQGRPAKKIWAIKLDRRKEGDDKDGDRIAYANERDSPTKFRYKDTSLARRPWQPQDVIAIEMEIPGKPNLRFNRIPTADSDYVQYVSDDGWVIREYEEGPTGVPIRFFFSKLVLNLLFNLFHFVGWFIALWLLLRFQWMHALGFAAVMWLVVTLTLLPMLLGYSGHVAANRQTNAAPV